MSRSARISMKAARVLEHVGACFCAQSEQWAVEELRRAMEPRRKRPSRTLKGRGCGICEKCLQGDVLHCPEWGAPRGVRASNKRAARRQETADIRRECLRRAGGVCECGCSQSLALEESAPWEAGAPQMDHMFGKGKGRLPQSVETCWLLRADCHRSKTRNEPDAATWWRRFIEHCRRHGYAKARAEAVKREMFVEVRASLPAAPKLGR